MISELPGLREGVYNTPVPYWEKKKKIAHIEWIVGKDNHEW
jgi:hypothetical protein